MKHWRSGYTFLNHFMYVNRLSALAKSGVLENEDALHRARKLFPDLQQKSLAKGDCGRVGVIGGSAEYTGAPFFASMTALHCGADLAYVYSHPSAAIPLKTYSPELIVYPTQEFDRIRYSLERTHTIVFGPGIGRELDHVVLLLKEVLRLVASNNQLCCVIDADGLFALQYCLDHLKGLNDQVILTPNVREFDRLYEKCFSGSEASPSSVTDPTHLEDLVKKLAAHLNVCVVRKDTDDIISDGNKVLIGRAAGSLRRCGGQGDILSGAIALFAFWEKLRLCLAENVKPYQAAYRVEHLLSGALAASDFVRSLGRRTFDRVGRAMTARDMVMEIPDMVRQEIDKK